MKTPVRCSLWKRGRKLLVSPCGRVWRAEYTNESGRVYPETELIGCTHGDGYKQLNIKDPDGVQTHLRVHRLIAEAFLPEYSDKKNVTHKDGDKLNNRVENLRFMSERKSETHNEKKKKATAAKERRDEAKKKQRS